jgi:hypothetical protein
MNVENITTAVVAILLIGWVIYRQLTWRLVAPGRMWRMPLILAVIGLVELSQIKGAQKVSGTDLAILGGELALALGVGAIMGVLAQFRTRPQRESDVASGRPAGETAAWDPTRTIVESRTGGWGAALWIVMIAVRIGIEFGARSLDNSALIASTGIILLVIAANRLARVAVILYRLDRKKLVAA